MLTSLPWFLRGVSGWTDNEGVLVRRGDAEGVLEDLARLTIRGKDLEILLGEGVALLGEGVAFLLEGVELGSTDDHAPGDELMGELVWLSRGILLGVTGG